MKYRKLVLSHVNFIFKDDAGLSVEDGPKMEKLNETSRRVM